MIINLIAVQHQIKAIMNIMQFFILVSAQIFIENFSSRENDWMETMIKKIVEPNE